MRQVAREIEKGEKETIETMRVKKGREMQEATPILMQ